AGAVLVTDDLNALGAAAIARGERQQAFERLQVPPAAALTDATVIRIGQLVGATQVIVGSLQLDGESLVVRARTIALESGRIKAITSTRSPPSPRLPPTRRWRAARDSSPACRRFS